MSEYIIYDELKWRLCKNGYYRKEKCIHGIRSSQYLHQYIYIKHYGKIPENYNIHHLNKNKNDNSPKNLILVTEKEHSNLHYGDNRGWHHTESAKKRMSIAKKGKPSPRKGIKMTNEQRNKLLNSHGKKILQFDLGGIYINSYMSISEASRKNGFNAAAISHCVTGRSKQSGGFIWRYA